MIAREIPRCNYHDDTTCSIEIAVFFTRQINVPRIVEFSHLLGVIHAKIDRFTNIAIRFGPGLTAFENLPGSQLIASLSHLVRHQFQVLRTILNFKA